MSKTFREIQARAIEIRQRYARLDVKNGGRRWNGEELALGFVGDVGDLVKLIQATEGIREIDGAAKKLKHELADCLWSVMVLADYYGVDLEAEFGRTMDELDAEIAAGGEK
ncbi:MAG: nucleotide pyrophosphohydrolase [Candidatus Nomurabacteria bacterium]|jgi:NTP pyrophosphatase (non-canonical NTP hydrolase)|nr:nucleotide pyrophosphohydrolase [Candidatus Nomurabacteria bacterium]